MDRTGLFSARGLAAFAGGASLAFIASRLLPPLLAQSVANVVDPFGVLVEDHRRFVDLLTQMERSQGASAFQRTQLFLRLKRGLAAHAMAEEDVIYPVLKEDVGDVAAANRLYTDHGAIKTHLYGLEQTIRDDAAWLPRVSALKNLLADHARQEEDIEFPRLRVLLDEEATARMARKVRREKAMVL